MDNKNASATYSGKTDNSLPRRVSFESSNRPVDPARPGIHEPASEPVDGHSGRRVRFETRASRHSKTDLSDGNGDTVSKNELQYIGRELDDTAPIWRMYRNEITTHDKEVTLDEWNKTLDILLIFAGLFSAVVTTFVVATYPLLKAPDDDYTATALYAIALALDNSNVLGTLRLEPPPKAAHPTSSNRTINALWFSSLFISLTVAFLSILAKQWLVEYNHRMSTPVPVSSALRSSAPAQDAQETNPSAAFSVLHGNSATVTTSATSRSWASRRYLFFKGLEEWHVSGFVTQFLPFLLHVGLFLFLAGLAMLLWSLDHIVAIGFLALTSLLAVFYIACIVLPILWQTCPSIPLVNRLIIMVPILLLELLIIAVSMLRYACTLLPTEDCKSDMTDPDSRTRHDSRPSTAVDVGANESVTPKPFAPMSLARMLDVLWDRRRGVIASSDADEDKQQADVDTLLWMLLVCGSENANLLAFQAISAMPLDADLRQLKPALQGITASSVLGNLPPATITAVDVIRVIRTELRLRQHLPQVGLDLSPAMLEALRESDLPDAQLLWTAVGGDCRHLQSTIFDWLGKPSSSMASTAALLLHYPRLNPTMVPYLLLLVNSESLNTHTFTLIRTISGSDKCLVHRGDDLCEENCLPDVVCDAVARVEEPAEDMAARSLAIIRVRGWERHVSSPVRTVRFKNQHEIFVHNENFVRFMASKAWLDDRVLAQVDTEAAMDHMIEGIHKRVALHRRDFAAVLNILGVRMAQMSTVLSKPAATDALLKALKTVYPDLLHLNTAASTTYEMVYCASFLLASTQPILLEIFKELFKEHKSGPGWVRSYQCPLATCDVHAGHPCGLQCIPSLIVKTPRRTEELCTLATCAIIRIMSLVALDAQRSQSFWWPLKDARVIEFVSGSPWANLCQHIQRDDRLCLVGLYDTLPRPEIRYCIALDNLLPVFEFQDFITERICAILTDLVRDINSLQGQSRRASEDWNDIILPLVRYFSRESDEPSAGLEPSARRQPEPPLASAGLADAAGSANSSTLQHRKQATVRWRLATALESGICLLNHRAKDFDEITRTFREGLSALAQWTWADVVDLLDVSDLASAPGSDLVLGALIDAFIEIARSDDDDEDTALMQTLVPPLWELAARLAAALCLSHCHGRDVGGLKVLFLDGLRSLISWTHPKTLCQEHLWPTVLHLAAHCVELEETWCRDLERLDSNVPAADLRTWIRREIEDKVTPGRCNSCK